MENSYCLEFWYVFIKKGNEQMEYIITIAIMIISIILLKMGLNIHIKDVKR